MLRFEKKELNNNRKGNIKNEIEEPTSIINNEIESVETINNIQTNNLYCPPKVISTLSNLRNRFVNNRRFSNQIKDSRIEEKFFLDNDHSLNEIFTHENEKNYSKINDSFISNRKRFQTIRKNYIESDNESECHNIINAQNKIIDILSSLSIKRSKVSPSNHLNQIPNGYSHNLPIEIDNLSLFKRSKKFIIKNENLDKNSNVSKEINNIKSPCTKQLVIEKPVFESLKPKYGRLTKQNLKQVNLINYVSPKFEKKDEINNSNYTCLRAENSMVQSYKKRIFLFPEKIVKTKIGTSSFIYPDHLDPNKYKNHLLHNAFNNIFLYPLKCSSQNFGSSNHFYDRIENLN